MGSPTPSRRIIMRNLPCLSRTPGSATPIRPLPKHVFLHEWWLVRASDKNNLHVAGFTSRGRQVMEIFHSAAIVKRHGTVRLESVDGITISISGLINSCRTMENGFSKEVCDKFHLGFPYNWEEFATASGRVSPSGANPELSRTPSSSKYMLPVAFEDLPAVAIRDLLMSIPEDSESSMMNIIVENIRKSYAGSSCSEGKMTDCLKEDASNGINYSFTKGNQTDNIANAVPEKRGRLPEKDKSRMRVRTSFRDTSAMPDEVTVQKKKRGKPPASDKEGHLGSLVEDSNTNKNEKPRSCYKSSNINVQKKKRGKPPARHKEGHLSSLVEDSNTNKNEKPESEGNSRDLSVEYVVPQSCNKSNKIDVQQKKRGRPPEKDKSRMQVGISFQDTSAMPDEVTPLSRCQVSSARKLSKQQNEINKFEESQKMSTLRRSTRLQNKPHVSYYGDDNSSGTSDEV